CSREPEKMYTIGAHLYKRKLEVGQGIVHQIGKPVFKHRKIRARAVLYTMFKTQNGHATVTEAYYCGIGHSNGIGIGTHTHLTQRFVGNIEPATRYGACMSPIYNSRIIYCYPFMSR